MKTKYTVIAYILNYITDSGRTALTSVAGAITGQIAAENASLNSVNTAFQHAAWTVAILAGLMTVINLFFPLRSFYLRYKRKHNEDPDTD